MEDALKSRVLPRFCWNLDTTYITLIEVYCKCTYFHNSKFWSSRRNSDLPSFFRFWTTISRSGFHYVFNYQFSKKPYIIAFHRHQNNNHRCFIAKDIDIWSQPIFRPKTGPIIRTMAVVVKQGYNPTYRYQKVRVECVMALVTKVTSDDVKVMTW